MEYWDTWKWGWHGMWGIVFYILLGQLSGKQTLKSLGRYLSNHLINLISSLICYWMLIIMWQYVGIDWIVTKIASVFFNDPPSGYFPQGKLSPASFLLALASHPLVNMIAMKLRKPHEKGASGVSEVG
jgi:hypothetical protein